MRAIELCHANASHHCDKTESAIDVGADALE